MPEPVKVDIKTIETKLDKNEKLTPEEEKFLMENDPAPEGYKGVAPEPPAPAVGEPAGDKAEKEKATADQKAKETLAARAKAAGLPDTATETDIQAAEKKKQDETDSRDPFVKLERALAENQAKEDHQISLPDEWTPREKAYFWQMRKDRKSRQQAEADRDAARFELSKVKKEKPPEPENKPEEKDPLEGKDPTDFLTVADVRKILERIKAAPPASSDSQSLAVGHPVVQSFLKACDEQAAQANPDYPEVMELTEEIINTNPAYQKQVAEALIQGKNPALKMYELIKADPEFAKLFPAAQTRVLARKKKPEGAAPEPKKEEPKGKTAEEIQKEKDAQAAEDKLKENAVKPRTSGHAEGEHFEGSDYTLEQITNMTDREFAKLPKKTREKYLELYG